ncbi:hypothetical protein ACFWPK_04390 [Nocardia sp. NPDC058519]
MNLPDSLDRLLVAIVHRVIAPLIDCTLIRASHNTNTRTENGHGETTH